MIAWESISLFCCGVVSNACKLCVCRMYTSVTVLCSHFGSRLFKAMFNPHERYFSDDGRLLLGAHPDLSGP